MVSMIPALIVYMKRMSGVELHAVAKEIEQ